MKGIVMTLICAGIVWVFWMTTVWVNRTKKKRIEYMQKYNESKKD